MTIKTKFITESEDFIDLSNLDQIVQDKQIFQTLFQKCLTEFDRLKYLNFTSSFHNQQLSFICPDFISFFSKIIELNVEVDSFEDCLYILNCQFDEMIKFSITICGSDEKPVFIHQRNSLNLLNLKSFSISYKEEMGSFYNNELLYLLRRMVNLEDLSLNFLNTSNMIIDGNTLKRYFIKQVPPLCRLKFNIYSMIKVNYLPHLQSIQEIQKTFENYENKIISSVHHFSKMNSFYCHVYSYPFTWTSYHYITNNFPGGLFRSVREISLHDEHPFEYDFFSRIAQSFPFVQKITLRNIEGQKDNHVQSSKVQFRHLIQIDLLNAHYDYIDEFLNDKKIFLFNDIHLYANYDSLEKVTNNFTRDETRMNCSKIIRLTSSKRMTNIDGNFQKYFPVAEISS